MPYNYTTGPAQVPNCPCMNIAILAVCLKVTRLNGYIIGCITRVEVLCISYLVYYDT